MINVLTVGVSTSPHPPFPENLELLLECLTCVVAIQSHNICGLRPGLTVGLCKTD